MKKNLMEHIIFQYLCCYELIQGASSNSPQQLVLLEEAKKNCTLEIENQSKKPNASKKCMDDGKWYVHSEQNNSWTNYTQSTFVDIKSLNLLNKYLFIGVNGVQVEELWSLTPENFAHLKPIHGLIFLFKWIPGQDEGGTVIAEPNDIFFAKQVINNACATQAILSVLLNCKHEDVDLGSTLTKFKEFTSSFDSSMKDFESILIIFFKFVYTSLVVSTMSKHAHLKRRRHAGLK
ncbi:hypothetical protein RND71_043285 [Anisodus tanguticus]|uniref:ubiquitinyl hydrolase 1 n=1 Tax=Anisodus tanguticus TaxID=243964 RepID=A0AAE1QS81_9SOLA|nr:hypothetical protein RND71_043285 [Anisodus tanguticus]